MTHDDDAPTRVPDRTVLRELTSRYVALDAQRRDIVDELEHVKDRMRTEIGPGRYDDDDVVVTITPGRRFDAELAMQVIPDALRSLVVREAVDAKLCRENLPPALYAQCQRDSGTLTVRVA